MLCAVSCAQAQVRYFDRVPSPVEIMAALNPQPTPAAGPQTPRPEGQTKTRGLEWGVGTTSAVSSNMSPAAAPAPQPPAGPALALPINFEFGTARLSRTSLAYIEAVVAVLHQNPEMRLMVEGHTDAAGQARANMMLSWERSFSVFRAMVERYGIDPARLQPVGKGSTEPLVATDPQLGANRRVQFRVLG